MKKGLKLLLVYFVVLITGTLMGSILYSLYLNVQNFVAGSATSGFNPIYFERAFFYFFSCMCILICPMLCYYRARHPHGFIQTLFYILICVITWMILLPSGHLLKGSVESRFSHEVTVPSLSKDIFRRTGNDVYYFLDDFKKTDGFYPEAPAVIIDTTEEGEVVLEHVYDTSDLDLYKAARPYREILIMDALKSEHRRPIIDLSLMVRRSDLALQKGWTYFIGFLSIAFVLCSLYGVSSFFSWKLISVVMIVLETMAILTFNTVYFYPRFDNIIYKLTNNKFFHFFDRFIDEPLLCLINVLIGLGFIITGIIHFAITKRKKA